MYSESNEEGVSGCSLESPIKYGHGAANFVKRLKLGVLREKAGEASCKFRRGRSEIEMGKLKDEAFTNRSGIRILCSCYSHGCNGMYESFEKYANSLKFFVECRAVAKLIADMKRGAVRGPAESEMRDFFSKHNLQWPRPVGDDEGSLFTIIAIVAAVLLLIAAGLLIVLFRSKRIQAMLRRKQDLPMETAMRKETTRATTSRSTQLTTASTAATGSTMKLTKRSTALSTALSSKRMKGRGSEGEDSVTENDLIVAIVVPSSTGETMSTTMSEADRKDYD